MSDSQPDQPREGSRRPWGDRTSSGPGRSGGSRGGAGGSRGGSAGGRSGSSGFNGGQRRPYGRDDRGRDDRGRDDRSGSGERRPFNRDDRGGSGERRPFNRDDRGGSVERRPFNRDDRGGSVERRPFNRDDRGGSGERRPFNRDDRGGRDDRRPFNRDDRGGSGERRPFNRDDRGGSGERRPYNRDDRDSRGRDDRRPYNRDDRDSRGRDDRRPFNRDGDSRSGGDRDDRRSGMGARRPSFNGPRTHDRNPNQRRGRGEDELTREQVREQERAIRPGLSKRADEPPVPEDHDPKLLPRQVRAELRGLPQDLAKIVGAHLQAAGELIDTDPELALAHAHAARRRAARLPIVREATAEVAYAAGDWSTALTEYRALHRMTGSDEFLPVLADCERALGRPREALNLARKAASAKLDADSWLEMVMVEAGARDDLDQRAEGIRVLRQAIGSRRGSKLTQARLRFALADLYEKDGHTAEAIELLGQAERLDTDNELEVGDRLRELGASSARRDDGIDVVAFDDSEDEPNEVEPDTEDSDTEAELDDTEDSDTEAELDDTEDDDTEDDDTEDDDTEDTDGSDRESDNEQ
ncbi:hypothetical protein ACSDQ9_00025 [Aestuariimicrobium soli]|uniref:tetratricopeptide repeat protein n=1 Tax=Aestuariimicrobium soli TaxID=2035834 RepID=UPI003EBF0E97